MIYGTDRNSDGNFSEKYALYIFFSCTYALAVKQGMSLKFLEF